MSLSSSLNAGVAGLSVNATRLAVISDNIANSSTNGYRRADVDFASLVTPTTANAYSAGGVTVATFRDVVSAGALLGTGNATDISVSGRGMLPVTLAASVDSPATERPFQMTATGAFTRDEDGYLVTRSGLVLVGIGVLGGLPLAFLMFRSTLNGLGIFEADLGFTVPAAFAASLIGVAILATVLPARRASGVAPVAALKE